MGREGLLLPNLAHRALHLILHSASPDAPLCKAPRNLCGSWVLAHLKRGQREVHCGRAVLAKVERLHEGQVGQERSATAAGPVAAAACPDLDEAAHQQQHYVVGGHL